MKHTEFTMAATDGLTLYGRRWLPETDSPKALLCLVHGYGEHSGRYHHVAEAFTAAGYAIVGFDQRGHGESGGPRGYTPSYNEQSMDDITTLISTAREQVPDLPTYLYCHSMGGGMGLGYILRRKPAEILGIVSSSPWLRLAANRPRWQVSLVNMIANIIPSATVSTKSKDADKPVTAESVILTRDVELEEAFRLDPHRHDTISYRLMQGAAKNGEWVMTQAQEFPIPLLLMHGDDDGITSFAASEEFARNAPSSLVTFKEWEGGYHELHNDLLRDELFEYVIAWLDQQIATN